MSFFLMYVIGVSLFRREAIKSSVCKPYKEMSIKARITRNNKWLLEMPSRETRDLVLQILSGRKIVCYRELISPSRISDEDRWLQFLFANIAFSLQNLTLNYTIIKALIRDPKINLQDY